MVRPLYSFNVARSTRPAGALSAVGRSLGPCFLSAAPDEGMVFAGPKKSPSGFSAVSAAQPLTLRPAPRACRGRFEPPSTGSPEERVSAALPNIRCASGSREGDGRHNWRSERRGLTELKVGICLRNRGACDPMSSRTHSVTIRYTSGGVRIVLLAVWNDKEAVLQGIFIYAHVFFLLSSSASCVKFVPTASLKPKECLLARGRRLTKELAS